MNGNQAGRRATAVLTRGVGHVRGCRIVVPSLCLLFWVTVALAADAPGSRLSDDIALTKATVSLLAAKDFKAVRDQFDSTIGQVSDETLGKMQGLIGSGERASTETIWSTETHSLQTGDGNSRVILEYKLAASKWVVADAVVKTQGGAKHFTRLYLTANTLPLSELNAFHLFGKGQAQYAFLAAWIAVIALTARAIVLAFRRQSGWRKWALMIAMPLGLTPSVAMNWNTAHVWVLEAVSNAAGQSFPLVAFHYPMVMVGSTEFRVPYLYISAPLIAFGYVIWHFGWARRRPPVEARADQATS
jgi:hypothetical protein